MSSVFTRIINNELPGRIIDSDEHCVTLLTIAPITTGHALVVPRLEIDRWSDLPVDLASHLMAVAHRISRAQMRAFTPTRIALVIAGFEVPHTHLHVIPADSMADLDFARADAAAEGAVLDAAATRLRQALIRLDN